MPKVAHVLSDAGYGGTEVHVRELARHLDGGFEQVALLAGAGPEEVLAPELRGQGVVVECIPELFRPGHGFRELLDAIRRHDPDVVHVHLASPVGFTKAFVAARAARIPGLISTEHGNAYHLRAIGGLAGRRLRAQARLRLRFQDRMIAVSAAQAHGFHEVLGTPSEQIAVVHNGIDPHRFTPDRDGKAVRAEFGIPSDAPVVGMVASFFEHDRAEDFVAAAAHVAAVLPDAHFVIIGDRHPFLDEAAAEVRGRVMDLAAELGLAGRLHLVGFRPDMPALMAALDVFVLAARYTTFGLVVIEAMATATPVVATAVGGVPEIITPGETGLLVPALAPVHLATALLQLLRDPALASRIGRAGRAAVVSRFSASIMAARTADIYRSVLADAPDRPSLRTSPVS